MVIQEERAFLMSEVPLEPSGTLVPQVGPLSESVSLRGPMHGGQTGMDQEGAAPSGTPVPRRIAFSSISAIFSSTEGYVDATRSRLVSAT